MVPGGWGAQSRARPDGAVRGDRAADEEAKHREETGQAEQDGRFALEQAAQKTQVLLKQLPSPFDLAGQQGHRAGKAGAGKDFVYASTALFRVCYAPSPSPALLFLVQ